MTHLHPARRVWAVAAMLAVTAILAVPAGAGEAPSTTDATAISTTAPPTSTAEASTPDTSPVTAPNGPAPTAPAPRLAPNADADFEKSGLPAFFLVGIALAIIAAAVIGFFFIRSARRPPATER